MTILKSPEWRRTLRFWLTFLVVCTVIIAGGWGAREIRQARTAVDLPMAPAREGEFLVIVPCRGELVAERSVQLTAPNIPNLQIVWTAPPGSHVKRGDVVLRFDSSAATQQLQEKEAALQQAAAALEQAEAEARITAEQDRRDLLAAQYEVEKARLEVSKQEIMSRLQGEEARIALRMAEDKLGVQQAANELNRASNAAKIAAAKRQLEEAQADVELIRRRLAQMEVRAPSDGVIVFLNNYSQGWMNAKPFKAGDSVFPGNPIAEIPDLKSLHLKGKLEEIDRGRVKPSQPANISVDSLPEKTFAGELAAISPLTERSFEWPPTRSFRAFARLKEFDSRLRPGMNGRADIIIERIPNAVSIPAKALFTRNGKPVVFVPAKREYKAVEVEIQARNADEVAVKGLAPGTMVTLVEVVERKP